jgi:hypothetical protein
MPKVTTAKYIIDNPTLFTKWNGLLEHAVFIINAGMQRLELVDVIDMTYGLYMEGCISNWRDPRSNSKYPQWRIGKTNGISSRTRIKQVMWISTPRSRYKKGTLNGKPLLDKKKKH